MRTTTYDVCFSGGALGADRLFGECALKAGHSLYHLHFDDRYKNRPNFRLLTKTELSASRPYLVRANKTLKRAVPTDEESYSYKLLARNYYQIRDTTKIYAVTRLIDGKVAGGTAWAIQMFIDANMDPHVYVFDQLGRGWLFYDKDQDSWKSVEPPKPHGYWTGIGSRELDTIGEEAIYSLFT